jgi:hypothetical protein
MFRKGLWIVDNCSIGTLPLPFGDFPLLEKWRGTLLRHEQLEELS